MHAAGHRGQSGELLRFQSFVVDVKDLPSGDEKTTFVAKNRRTAIT
jgi:hypothetical protein